MPTNVGINANLIILKFDGKEEEEERYENGWIPQDVCLKFLEESWMVAVNFQ